MPEGTDPIDSIEWIEAESLHANDYNPNMVMNQELRLLERSIVLNGWIQPILVNKNYTVIDGFHRWRLAMESEALRERYKGRVPCAVLSIDDVQAMMLTVRINRAKGSHGAVRMSDLVRDLVENRGCSIQEVCIGIGATEAEVKLLLTGGLKKSRKLDDYKYSEAWHPIETRHKKKAAEEAQEFERETDD